MVRTGHSAELYDYSAQLRFQNLLISHADVPMPFIRPAYEAALLAVFSLLRFREAYFLFLAVNLALIVMVYRLLRPRMEKLAAIYSWLPAAIFLAFLPVAAALIQGQDSILLLALLATAMVASNCGRELLAGVLVGLTLFKFQAVIPIFIVFGANYAFAQDFSQSVLLYRLSQFNL
jgi:hypothetical protein